MLCWPPPLKFVAKLSLRTCFESEVLAMNKDFFASMYTSGLRLFLRFRFLSFDGSYSGTQTGNNSHERFVTASALRREHLFYARAIKFTCHAPRSRLIRVPRSPDGRLAQLSRTCLLLWKPGLKSYTNPRAFLFNSFLFFRLFLGGPSFVVTTTVTNATAIKT